jgi:hypothetical protein
MPYVMKGVRDHYAPYLEPLTRWVREHGAVSGELNYLITSLMIAAVEEDSGCLTYGKLQAVVGAATEAAAEFRRRMMAPFEMGKAKANGDLYKDLEKRVLLSASSRQRSRSSG